LLSEPFDTYKEHKHYYPSKVANDVLSANGLIDEVDWESAKSIKDFIQVKPNYGSIPSKKTEVKILYDDQFLYIAVYLFDNPENIKKKNAIYDDWYEGFENNSDYFVVEIDSEHKHQQSYCFAVNSSGVQADYTMYNDGYVDDDWNAAYWNAKTSIVDDGWIIEYEIPFKILEYHKNKSMGINFIRFSHSDKELHYWVLLPIEIDGTVSHYGHINDLILPNSRDIKFSPYLVSGKTKFNNYYYALHQGEIDEGSLMHDNSPNNIDRLGFDINYSINNYLTLSYTHNPDFGQIEQNVSDINFTSFEDFYIEKRPFFINNSYIFFTPIKTFYSQRIGSNIIYNNQLLNVSIDDALRIDGLGNNDFYYNVLFSQSSIENPIDVDKKIKTIVSRIKKNLINDNSYLGFTNTIYEDFQDYSKTYSIDGLFNLLDNKLKIDGQIALSSIDRISHNGLGQSYELSYTNIINSINNHFFNNNVFDLWINYQRYDENFYINHTGYLQRNDYSFLNIGLAFTENNPIKYSIYRAFNIQAKITKNTDNDRLNSSASFSWANTFINNYTFTFNYIKTFSHYDDWLFLDYNYDYLDIGDSPIVKKPESDEFRINFQTDPTYNLFLDYSLGYFNNDIGDLGITYYIHLNYKPTEWLSFDFDYNVDDYSDKYNLLKIRRNYPPNLGNTTRTDEYLFSDSKIFKKQIALSVLTYFSKQFSIELFSRYFIYDNDFSSNTSYYKLSENYIYPDEMEEITDYSNDRLLYGADYSSLEFNCIFKWAFDRKINLYLIYSSYKGINGIKFDKLHELINYEFIDDGSSEVYDDESIFIKFDFLLNN